MVRGLDLEWSAHVALAVEAGVVLSPHPFERREFDLLDCPPGPALADQLGLVEVVDGLGHRVVVRVADGSGGGDGAEFDGPVGVDLNRPGSRGGSDSPRG